MSDVGPGAAEELAKLTAENERLRRDVLALRKFIDSMQNLVDAVDNPLPEAELMELLSRVLDDALQTINAKDGSLLVLDDSGELVFVLAHGDVPSDQLKWRSLPAGQGIAGWVVENRKATIVNDAQMDDRFFPGVDREFEFHTSSVLAAPIIGGGEVLGVVEMLNKRNGQLFNTGDQTLLTLLCRFAGELLYSVIKGGDR